MIESKLEASVGMSRKWDAREAGREVAETAIKNLSEPPSFFLLFSTIHYEKHGGFQEFLNGVWDVLPKETPLVGGTIPGFMNQHGCFTRGATALACYSSNIDIEISVGHNTKRSPKKTVSQCLSKFKKKNEGLSEFFIEIVSGPEIPNFPRIGRQTVVKSKVSGSVLAKMMPILSILNMGIDRSDEILNQITDKNSKSKLIGVVCLDDRRLFKNYQFYGKNVLQEALCLIKITSSLDFELKTAFGLNKKAGIKADIDISSNKHLVSKINNKEATTELYNIIGINSENVKMVDKFYSQAFYYPFGYYKDRFIHTCMLGGILGEKVYFANQVCEKNLILFELTGKGILRSTKELYENLSENIQLNFSVMCETYIETLGNNIYQIFDLIKSKTSQPFLVVFAGGESVYYGDGIPHHLYESLNNLTIK